MLLHVFSSIRVLQPDKFRLVYIFIFLPQLFTQVFADNSTLDDAGLVPPPLSLAGYSVCYITTLRNDVFILTLAVDPLEIFGPDGVPSNVLRNCTCLLAFCLVKLPCIWLSTSIFPSCWNFDHIQLVLKNDDSFLSFTLLLSCTSKILKAVLKHLSDHVLLLDHLSIWILQRRYTGGLLASQQSSLVVIPSQVFFFFLGFPVLKNKH